MKVIALISSLACVLSWGLASIPAKSAAANPTVTVNTGELRGSLTSDGVAVFKGIPFAQPPTGNLRWREPLPAKSWTGVRDATVFGPACAQSGHLNATSSEDCLQLNVWTPRWPMRSPVPVMVWIHGGGNIAGSGVEPLFNGEALARHGIVLVTINYRLGVFGFFSHPRAHQRVAAPCLRKLRAARSNYGLALGAREHRQIRRRPWQCHDIRRIGRSDGCKCADDYPPE